MLAILLSQGISLSQYHLEDLKPQAVFTSAVLTDWPAVIRGSSDDIFDKEPDESIQYWTAEKKRLQLCCTIHNNITPSFSQE